MAFIVDNYSKYNVWDREHAVYKFEINGNWYAIKSVEMEWGLPQIGLRIDQEEHPEYYQVYSEYKDALEFVRQMKMVNAR